MLREIIRLLPATKGLLVALLTVLLCVYAFPLSALANEGARAGEAYPDKDGYVQIDGIYAFDAATYPFGTPLTCGGYDYDGGAWVRDTPTVTEKGSQIQFEARGTFVAGNLEDPSANPSIEDGIVLNSSALTWSVSDTSLATIDFQSGLFTPLANGTVKVTATLNASKSYSGQPMRGVRRASTPTSTSCP